MRETKKNRKTKDRKKDSWGRSIALFTYLWGLAGPLSFLWLEKNLLISFLYCLDWFYLNFCHLKLNDTNDFTTYPYSTQLIQAHFWAPLQNTFDDFYLNSQCNFLKQWNNSWKCFIKNGDGIDFLTHSLLNIPSYFLHDVELVN